MKRNSIFGASLALAAISTSVGAQAANGPATCLSEDEIAALTIYVMPQVITATQATCKTQLSPGGFIASSGTAMAQRYAAMGNAVWPQAKSAIIKFAGESKDKDMAEFTSLPDDAIRPLLDAFIQQELSQAIKPKSCRDIERLSKVLDRLDPETTGALTGVIASLALGDKDKPKICEAVSS